MRKYFHLVSTTCVFFDYQRRNLIKTLTLLPVRAYSRLWLDFIIKKNWIWERQKHVFILPSPVKKFREKYQNY